MSRKGSQDFHKIHTIHKFIQSVNENKSMDLVKKWEHECSVPINNKILKDILNVCFHTIKDISLLWFQCRIINSILETRACVHRIGVVHSLEVAKRP